MQQINDCQRYSFVLSSFIFWFVQFCSVYLLYSTLICFVIYYSLFLFTTALLHLHPYKTLSYPSNKFPSIYSISLLDSGLCLFSLHSFFLSSHFFHVLFHLSVLSLIPASFSVHPLPFCICLTLSNNISSFFLFRINFYFKNCTFYITFLTFFFFLFLFINAYICT